MENDPRRRRSRGGRRRGGGGAPQRARPVRTPAEPKPAQQARGLARRERPRRRPQRSADDLRPGTPCVIVMDCREGEPDRTGAAALFEGFFDLETGEPRRMGYGVPRLRIVAPAEPSSPDVRTGPAVPAPSEPHSAERVWGFECWWRPDPQRAGLTEIDQVEVEQSKKLLRGLLRDSRRAARPLSVR